MPIAKLQNIWQQTFLLCCDFEVWGVDVCQKLGLLLLGGSPLDRWYCGRKERIFSCLRLSISLLLLLLVSIISCISLISCKMCGEIYKGWISIVFHIYLFWIGFETIFNCILYLFYRDKIAIKQWTFLRYERDWMRRRAEMEYGLTKE